MKKNITALILFSLFLTGCTPAGDVTTQIIEETKPVETNVENNGVKTEEVPVQKVEQKVSAEVLLAQCLTDNGVKLYTSRTCPHCTNQKALFKDGLEFLISIDCLNKEGTGWTDECKNNEINVVPTWIFSNGDILSGETSLETLAQKAGCEYKTEAPQ